MFRISEFAKLRIQTRLLLIKAFLLILKGLRVGQSRTELKVIDEVSWERLFRRLKQGGIWDGILAKASLFGDSKVKANNRVEAQVANLLIYSLRMHVDVNIIFSV